jgi:hypothetical protein
MRDPKRKQVAANTSDARFKLSAAAKRRVAALLAERKLIEAIKYIRDCIKEAMDWVRENFRKEWQRAWPRRSRRH